VTTKILLCSFFIILFSISFVSGHPDIMIENRHLVLKVTEGDIFVTDAILFKIDKTDIGKRLDISLPGGYKDLDIIKGLDESSLAQKHYGPEDLKASKVGKLPVILRYTLKIKGDSYSLSFRVNYDTNIFYLLVKNIELGVESEDLIDEGIIDMGNAKLHAFSEENIKKGGNINFKVKGLGKKTRRGKALILSAIILVIIGILFIFVFSKGKKSKNVVKQGKLENRQEKLVSLIAELDEQYERGEIDDKSHKRMRKEYKKNLKNIILEIEKGVNGINRSRES